jgi:ubiquinone/menaquinone biosynthesis C-methylase UbiE
MSVNFKEVTELSGEEISYEQLQRLCNRYYWAANYCKNKDVLEVACGTGPGLGYLSGISNKLIAGDISEEILDIARKHYGNRIDIRQFNACEMPFLDQTFDVILIFEAIYYLPDVKKFIKECRRILRPNGFLLIGTANKDLYDFNPSPYSYCYYGVMELRQLLENQNFTVSFYGGTSVKRISLRQKFFRPLKKIALSLNVMPQTMKGKAWLKKLVFGSLIRMPAEIGASTSNYEPPVSIPVGEPNRNYKVIFCAAQMINNNES